MRAFFGCEYFAAAIEIQKKIVSYYNSILANNVVPCLA